MELGFVLALAAITFLVIGLLLFFGLKLNKAVMEHSAEIAMPLSITFAGTLLWACVVAFWIICLVAAILRPESTFGAFVGTAAGMASVLVLSVVFAGVAGFALEKLGYPIATRDDDNA